MDKLRALNKLYFQNSFYIYLAIEAIQVTTYKGWNVFKVTKKITSLKYYYLETSTFNIL